MRVSLRRAVLAVAIGDGATVTQEQFAEAPESAPNAWSLACSQPSSLHHSTSPPPSHLSNLSISDQL
jgi:invasion protein IalB